MKGQWLVVTLLMLSVAVSACASSASSDVTDLQIEVAGLTEQTQRAQVMAALEPLDPLRYHQLDAMVRNDGRIPAAAVVWATRARETLLWVDWPAELDGHVEQYSEWLDALIAAFLDDDAAAAAEPSKITHALAHTFEAALEAWLNLVSIPPPPPLAGLEPPTHAGHGDDASHEMSMQDDQDSQHGDHEAESDEEASGEENGHE